MAAMGFEKIDEILDGVTASGSLHGVAATVVGRDGVLIALMAALTESTLRMLANTSAYPESANYPNDGNGGDHDSLGLFQMRPQSGWGTVAELMDTTYQARAFYGGPDGPNHGSPRGLVDIPGWEQMDPAEAAQAVEVSAYPDRYRDYDPVAETILDGGFGELSLRRIEGLGIDPLGLEGLLDLLLAAHELARTSAEADASALTDDAMARFARWTNLSETTFLLPPTVPEADYRVRIFTPGGELPFAGHPTLDVARVHTDLLTMIDTIRTKDGSR